MPPRARYWRHRHALDWLLCERYYPWLKRALDLSLCLLLLPLLLPVMGLIALLIVLDSPGNPILVQPRTGFGGKRFGMLKFRTMVRNAEELKAKYAHLNELTWPDFKIKNDPRITRVGRILRRTSLDELPQLFNVLRGEMSFIGPRPTSFAGSTYALWQTQRLDAIPGISGLWQVKGRGTMLFDARSRIEIDYVRHCCLWRDVQLLGATIVSVVARRGAY